jgi:hypothetical protein
MQTNIEELEVNGVKYVRKDSASQPDLSKQSIVRCQNAGVFCGEILEKNLTTRVVKLKSARRLWYWDGAASLSQLAVTGPSKPQNCKFPVPVPEIELTEVLEVIPCSAAAAEIINKVPVWKA